MMKLTSKTTLTVILSLITFLTACNTPETTTELNAPATHQMESTAEANQIEIEKTLPEKNIEKPSGSKSKPKSAKKGEKQSINLELQSSAKKVYVVGDFNKWYRQPLKREGNNWKVTVKIAPGTYQYVFVVDDGKNGGVGKRIPDPNNPQKSKDGKASILTVKTDTEEN